MRVISVISTKGGEGKSTHSANLAGFCADALMPDSIGQIADYMQRNYRTSDAWWSGSALPGDYDAATF